MTGGGTNDTVQSIVAGTDLEMPGPPIRYGKALTETVKTGKVSEKDHLDSFVTRLLRLLDRAGLLDPEREERAGQELDSDLPEFRQTARQAASDGIVLLKNSGILPLVPHKINKLAIIGPNAKIPTTGGTGSAAVNPYYITNPFDSISRAAKELNPTLDISFAQGILTDLQPRLPGDMLKTPDGTKKGIQLDFYAGHEFQGPVLGTSYWQNSVMFTMSDGDTPDSLRGKASLLPGNGSIDAARDWHLRLQLIEHGQGKAVYR